MQSPPIAWTVAGLDASGAAGLGADLRTFSVFGVHGCAVSTAVTAQNSRGVSHIAPLPRVSLEAQLRALALELPPRAIKTGMLGTAEAVDTVAGFIRELRQDEAAPKVVCDPVLAASDGSVLLDDGGYAQLLGQLLPQCDLLTPNLPEAEKLTGRQLRSPDDIVEAARQLLNMGVGSVLIKGGHGRGEVVNNYFTDGSRHFILQSKRRPGDYRGTGCVLSAAIAAAVATGSQMADALVLAENCLQSALEQSYRPGRGQMRVPAVLTSVPKRQTMPLVWDDFAAKAPAGGFAPCALKGRFLYPVVDAPHWLPGLAEAGISLVQLRLKSADGAQLPLSEAQPIISEACEIARREGIRLVVNDYWEAAIRCGAWGLHLGQEDLHCADLGQIAAAGLRLGISTHCWWELMRALALEPSYIALGPVFATSSKEMAFAPLGTEKMRQMRQLVGADRPCVAIGGIDSDNVGAVLAAGAEGIALISAICGAADWRCAASRLRRMVESENGE